MRQAAEQDVERLLGECLALELDPQLGRAERAFEGARSARRRWGGRAWGGIAAAVVAGVGAFWSWNTRHPSPVADVGPAVHVAESDEMDPVELGRTVSWRTLDEGTVVLDDDTPARRVRRQMIERIEYYDPRQKAIVEMTVPKEEIFLVGMERY